MISSSEVGGCCRVQVAWLPPRLPSPPPPLPSPASPLKPPSSPSLLASCRHSTLPLSRRFSLFLSLFPRSSSLGPFIVPFNPLSCSRLFCQPPKIQTPTAAEATHARRGLRACKVVLPSTPGVAARNVSTIYGAIVGTAEYIFAAPREFLFQRESYR